MIYTCKSTCIVCWQDRLEVPYRMGVKPRSEVTEESNLIIILKWIINIKLVKYWILISPVLNSAWGSLNYVSNACPKRHYPCNNNIYKKKRRKKIVCGTTRCFDSFSKFIPLWIKKKMMQTRHALTSFYTKWQNLECLGQ